MSEFKWNCYKDLKPERDMYVYTYFPEYRTNGVGIDVGIDLAKNIGWDDCDYWCYVFIPNPPKIEEKLTLEERIERLEKLIEGYFKE